jgi:hypothetical protein
MVDFSVRRELCVSGRTWLSREVWEEPRLIVQVGKAGIDHSSKLLRHNLVN